MHSLYSYNQIRLISRPEIWVPLCRNTKALTIAKHTPAIIRDICYDLELNGSGQKRNQMPHTPENNPALIHLYCFVRRAPDIGVAVNLTLRKNRKESEHIIPKRPRKPIQKGDENPGNLDKLDSFSPANRNTIPILAPNSCIFFESTASRSVSPWSKVSREMNQTQYWRCQWDGCSREESKGHRNEDRPNNILNERHA